MKLIKEMLLITFTAFTPIIAYSQPSIIESTSHYVVSPGTRLIAGDRKLNEFYILGARSANPIPAKHVGVKAKIVKKDNTHKMKVAMKRAFKGAHHHVAQRKSHILKANAHKAHNKIAAHKKTHAPLHRFASRSHAHNTVARG